MFNKPDSMGPLYILPLLGITHTLRKDARQAKSYLLRALRSNQNVQDLLPVYFTMAACATLLVNQGENEVAAELLTVLIEHPLGDLETQKKLGPLLDGLKSHLDPSKFGDARATRQKNPGILSTRFGCRVPHLGLLSQVNQSH